MVNVVNMVNHIVNLANVVNVANMVNVVHEVNMVNVVTMVNVVASRLKDFLGLLNEVTKTFKGLSGVVQRPFQVV